MIEEKLVVASRSGGQLTGHRAGTNNNELNCHQHCLLVSETVNVMSLTIVKRLACTVGRRGVPGWRDPPGLVRFSSFDFWRLGQSQPALMALESADYFFFICGSTQCRREKTN